MPRIGAAAAAAAAALTLCACSTAPYRLDDSHRARSQSPRVQFIVLHYTSGDFGNAFHELTEGDVSAHYLVSDDTVPVVYRLVDETQAAHHAGLSEWQGHTFLNQSSIGIEIVNHSRDDGPVRRFMPYPQPQIDAVIALVKDLVQRYHVPPDHVVGHSDIAPQRKQDPGPTFPWRQLAAAGLVRWPDAAQVDAARQGFAGLTPDLAWFQQRLAQLGYAVPQTEALDEPMRRVIAAFQMKYRPARFDGEPDVETAALLAALTS